MMQSLLEEQLKLKVHQETREVPIYALGGGERWDQSAAGKGSLFHPWLESPDLAAGGESTASFLRDSQASKGWRGDSRRDDGGVLPSSVAGGHFRSKHNRPDWDCGTVRFRFALAQRRRRSTHAGRSILSAQGALGELGLRLVDATGPCEFIVIDHAERPSAN